LAIRPLIGVNPEETEMSYASILVAISGAPDDKAAVAIAADLARRGSGVVRVLTDVPQMASAWTLGMGRAAFAAGVYEALATAREALRTKAIRLVEQEAKAFGLTCGADGPHGRIDLAEGADTAWSALMQELPLTDLIVLAQSSAAGEGPWSGVLAEALMSARAPVFIARDGVSTAGRPAAVAWDGSLEAGRAVRAALPLLKEASEVTVLQDPDELEAPTRGCADPDRLVRYLSAHGAGPVTVIRIKGRKTDEMLLRAAASADAALLVAGAFGHSRLQETLFGGVTRAFLAAKDGPHLLLSH
jgi:nucleotide-binding universal stress UspA family protein